MTSKETKSEAILRDLREHKGEKPASKRKRFSRLIVVFDALIILIILLIIANRKDSSDFYTSKISVNSAEIIYTITEIPETKNMLFSLTFKGLDKKINKILLQGSLAKLTVYDGTIIVHETEIGSGMKQIVLEDDETRIFTEEIESDILDNYFKNIKKIKPRKRSIIDFTSRTYELKSEVVLNFSDSLTIPLNFKYEVSND
jgi:hypothetical protein